MSDNNERGPNDTSERRREPIGRAVADQVDGGRATAVTDKPKGRHLIVRVFEGGESKANIRIPVGLARVAGKFIPAAEKENLKKQGIDVEEILGELTGDELGPLVQVDEEGKSVWIGVE